MRGDGAPPSVFPPHSGGEMPPLPANTAGIEHPPKKTTPKRLVLCAGREAPRAPKAAFPQPEARRFGARFPAALARKAVFRAGELAVAAEAAATQVGARKMLFGAGLPRRAPRRCANDGGCAPNPRAASGRKLRGAEGGFSPNLKRAVSARDSPPRSAQMRKRRGLRPRTPAPPAGNSGGFADGTSHSPKEHPRSGAARKPHPAFSHRRSRQALFCSPS